MSRFLLDTNICIAFLNGNDEDVRRRIVKQSPGECMLCSVVKAELYFGARHSQRVAHNLEKLDAFFDYFPSLPFDDAASQEYGVIREQLSASGRPIGANDLMIAAIAKQLDLTLVTRDQNEFQHVAGLRLAAW